MYDGIKWVNLTKTIIPSWTFHQLNAIVDTRRQDMTPQLRHLEQNKTSKNKILHWAWGLIKSVAADACKTQKKKEKKRSKSNELEYKAAILNITLLISKKSKRPKPYKLTCTDPLLLVATSYSLKRTMLSRRTSK